LIVTRIVVRISKTLNISGKAKGNHKVISFVVVMNKIYIVSVIFDTHFFVLQSSSS
jgi:cytoskeletal protein CcmA (bactofilin family)